MTKLFPDQLLAAENFEEWLLNDTTPIAGLWASGGYGKSFSVRHLIEEVVIKNSNYNPIITSMTHSAVDVLADFIGRDVSTLHSIMGWIPYRDKDTGEEGISTPQMRDKNVEPRLLPGTLLVVDEAGLCGHEEVRLLQEAAADWNIRILFIGDHKQCYPVCRDDEELCIPAFNNTDCMLELTTPKRVDETDMIYKLSQVMRKTVDGARQPKLKTVLNTDGSGKGVRVVDDIEEIAYKAFKAGVRDGNTRNIKVLAFTNKRCLNLNRKIRKNVMGLKDPTPIVGEEMVANTSIPTATNDGVLIRNNQRVVVKEVEKTESFGLKGAFILFEDMTGEELDETVFVPSTPDKFQERLKSLANKATGLRNAGETEEAGKYWRAFYSLKEGCADIRFTYAMTVNKAQGTTLKHALVDLDDINQCRDKGQKARMAYTAITRATDFVTIEGELT